MKTASGGKFRNHRRKAAEGVPKTAFKGPLPKRRISMRLGPSRQGWPRGPAFRASRPEIYLVKCPTTCRIKMGAGRPSPGEGRAQACPAPQGRRRNIRPAFPPASNGRGVGPDLGRPPPSRNIYSIEGPGASFIHDLQENVNPEGPAPVSGERLVSEVGRPGQRFRGPGPFQQGPRRRTMSTHLRGLRRPAPGGPSPLNLRSPMPGSPLGRSGLGRKTQQNPGLPGNGAWPRARNRPWQGRLAGTGRNWAATRRQSGAPFLGAG